MSCCCGGCCFAHTKRGCCCSATEDAAAAAAANGDGAGHCSRCCCCVHCDASSQRCCCYGRGRSQAAASRRQSRIRHWRSCLHRCLLLPAEGGWGRFASRCSGKPGLSVSGRQALLAEIRTRGGGRGAGGKCGQITVGVGKEPSRESGAGPALGGRGGFRRTGSGGRRRGAGRGGVV